jgi:hypothetical protein
VVRFIDVLQGPVLQASGTGIVFFLVDIVVGFVEQFKSLAEAVGSLEVGIDGGVIPQVFAVIDGGMLDLADCGIDFIDRVLLLVVDSLVRTEAIKMSARMAKVVERMQIGGMSTRFVRQGHAGKCGQKEKHQRKSVEKLHACHLFRLAE